MFVNDTALYDLRLLSTIGFDDADISAVSAVEGVTAAAGSANADFISRDGETESVYRAHMLTDGINEPMLTAGSLPTRGDECLADAGRFSEDMIGQKITVSETDEDDILAYEEYTITGLASSPLYISVERGTSSLGDGSLDAFVLHPARGLRHRILHRAVRQMRRRFRAVQRRIRGLRRRARGRRGERHHHFGRDAL